jgi:hypothetical protein
LGHGFDLMDTHLTVTDITADSITTGLVPTAGHVLCLAFVDVFALLGPAVASESGPTVLLRVGRH